MPKILISAGEASGDLYASRLVEEIRKRLPSVEFFGCAGPRMRQSGVRTVVDAASLSVVGLVEVLSHVPRIYREFRRISDAAKRERPHLAILTDSPDFHLRLARRLHRMGIPVVYLVGPQAWAWRRGRVRTLKNNVVRLLCIFPFEEEFFRRYGVPATYIGHPLARIVRPTLSRDDFFRKHRLPMDRPMVALLPGSRAGEIARHLPPMLDGVDRLYRKLAVTFVLATASHSTFKEPIARAPIKLIEGETWDIIAHADLALAASGTVTIEAALLGTPMVTFYRVTGLSWWMGRLLVNIPFYTMVNLVAGRQIVPELMQNELTGQRLAAEAERLLRNAGERVRMKRDLLELAGKLSGSEEPMEKAARIVEELLSEEILRCFVTR